jgi:PhzF family phenazine biosynthesis protein
VSPAPVSRRFHTLDVFTDRLHGGNPLAVFPDGTGLSTAQMQGVAGELNLSETVFIFPPERGGTRRVRIFTPRRELPFAGHPTLGTAHLLASLGDVPLVEGERATRIVLEEEVGPVPVTIDVQGGEPVFARLTAAKLPELGPPPPPDDVLAGALSLEPADIGSGDWRPAALSAGVPYLFVRLGALAGVARRLVVPGRLRLRARSRAAAVAHPCAHVRAGLRHRRGSGDGKRRGSVRRLSRSARWPDAPWPPALGDRAGLRDGAAEPPARGSGRR